MLGVQGSVQVQDMLMNKQFIFGGHNVQSACRSLFGPVDHDEVRKTLRRELAITAQRNQAKYNFDFSLEKPLPGSWTWQKVEPFSVPKAYKMPQLNVQMDLRMVRIPEAEVRAEEIHEKAEAVAEDAAVTPTLSASEDTTTTLPASSSTSTQTSPRKRKRQAHMTEFFPSVKKSRAESSKVIQP